MQINLAKSAGFCFGVKRALNIALSQAQINNNIVMFGDIVHNEDVVNKIKQAGIKKISNLGNGKNKIILIRAHGEPKSIFRKAKKLGYKILDATCPMVKEIHKIAQNLEKEGYKIIIIGDKKHDEVKGIMGQLKTKTITIDDKNNIPLGKIKKNKKYAVVVQSTQNIEKVNGIVKILKKNTDNLKFFNTICRPTTTKQQEIRSMPKKNDLMLIIGSKNSANTKRLYEISRHINKQTYWIQSACDIKPKWIKDIKKVGISAGASTPDETVKEVVSYIASL